MKKITLFFATLAVAFGVNAANGDQQGLYFGCYDGATGTFIESEDDKIGLNINYKCLNFAVQATNPTSVELLQEAPGRVIAFQGLRISDTYFFTNKDFRMVAAPNAKFDDGTPAEHVYVIQGYDLGDLVGGELTPENSTGGGAIHLHSMVFVAGPDVEDTDPAFFWWEESTAAGFGAYVYLGELNLTNTSCDDCTNYTLGVADAYADENDATIVGYYNMLGQQLQDEPESGMFIAKYSNGKSVKYVK